MHTIWQRVLQLRSCSLVMLLGVVYAASCLGAEAVQAPPNHAIVADTINGWYFVPKALKEEYDASLRRLEGLKAEIDAGQLDATGAVRELDAIKARLQTLRETIAASRVHVAGAEIHEQIETHEFDLGAERRLAITANQVRVVGWDGPNVKIELKKMVLSNDGGPVDEHLRAISIIHKHERAAFAGDSDAAWNAREAEFLAKEGANLTTEQLASRREFVDSIRRSYAIHRELVDKVIDQVTVAGLDYESNKAISMQVKSEEGDGRFGSVRQRYAEVTAYVPPCTSVTIRGARRGLRVENVTADVYITSEDSTDSDDRGQFEVVGVTGKLVCRDFPLRTISGVHGDVIVNSNTEFDSEGAGTSHRDDMRDLTPGRPFAVQVNDISGDIDLHYGRVNLVLGGIAGRINVVNEFGDTTLVVESPMSQAAHRIFSQSGRIDVELTEGAWSSVPFLAVTNHGGVRTNIPRREGFEDFRLEGEDARDHVRRNFAGFRTVVPGEDRLAVFELFQRFPAIATGGERSSGLDLFTRAGRIVVLRK